jgi:hypothetical protein
VSVVQEVELRQGQEAGKESRDPSGERAGHILCRKKAVAANMHMSNLRRVCSAA